jgi:Type II CAAX prenyl endopeptidase Rce1-like
MNSTHAYEGALVNQEFERKAGTEQSRLERAFLQKPLATGFVFTLGTFLVTGGLRALFTKLLPDGPHQEALAGGLQQTILSISILGLMWHMGWLRLGRVLSRPHRPRTWWPWLILITAILPIAGFLDVDWSKTSAIAASTFDYVTTGLVEELGFRGLLLTGLILGFKSHNHAWLKVVVASSFLFGLPHISPVGIVFATLFGFSFAYLAISTNTIWFGVAVHIAFDLFTDLPDATAQISGRWYVFVPIFCVLFCGIVALVQARKGFLTSSSDPKLA